MQNNAVKKVVIAGGGTAGWVAAAALSKKLGELVDVVLVESEQIGTVGVGEATIPPMRVFHSLIGVDEQEFMRATEAVFKLGISFKNWGQVGDEYFHPFGTTGQSSFLADFQHFWLYGKSKGIDAGFGEYNLEAQAALANKFATSKNGRINFAYHLDATRYAQYLRQFSEKLGAKRIEGKIQNVQQHENGDIKALELESGEVVEGDLFIDCTGFTGLLIDKTLNVPFEDWSHWLPCNSAIAVQTESVEPAKPYVTCTAHQAGWQWHIPLQHRVGNGNVFCSEFMSDEQAKQHLLDNVQGKVLTEPRVIKYKTGRRKVFWSRNCVALGLSSGFVEPLESTSIYLFMIGVTRLMKIFPFHGITQTAIDEYNRQAIAELENVRDFIVLHYHATEREDSEFWRYCKNMDVPDSLTHRIELFRENGLAFQGDQEMFRLESWTHVMLGQGITPKRYHSIFSTMSDEELVGHLSNTRNTIAEAVSKMPNHQEFVNHYCKATR
ncbi:tryptophan 7-halogenase [Gilvimarinus sp. SDUM040013]|uniref:Tryptophan halogenase family protein n=1 Tax=Gilvimarinus gilvus TaxID=3058038 RepID=A0ABU4S300_9GAMM|nr:tryptophan halogenase family protein [Gilvimarinus sp. SDUM040013]MDO3387138.1 tryptophan 7-halogenase [Gilvimarinus sp. SDUM040013]MDX6850881.1 tryptophan halogenase family protein [Gilvimarinus sp. SDUM040013]